MNLDHIKQIAANMRKAVRDRETVSIGGGEFDPKELASAALALEMVAETYGASIRTMAAAPKLLAACERAERLVSQLDYMNNRGVDALADDLRETIRAAKGEE